MEKNATAISFVKAELLRRVQAVGFLDARVAAAELPDAHSRRLLSWLSAEMHGEMEYMERTGERRASAETVLEGARSIIVVAASYHPGPAATESAENLKIAKYALGEDYHWVFRERLTPVVEWLDTVLPGEKWRICVDSAPLLERAYAVESGIGFFGKNSLVITPAAGSYTLLAEIVTTAEIEPDPPTPGTCGTCTRCIDACPTDAIVSPGTVDARRCLSYLTIEKKSPLTPEESDSISQAGWVFGCDICQDVCPYNKRPPVCQMEELAEGRVVSRTEPPETFLQPQSNSQFERRFARSPILRPGRRRVQAHARLFSDSPLPGPEAASAEATEQPGHTTDSPKSDR